MKSIPSSMKSSMVRAAGGLDRRPTSILFRSDPSLIKLWPLKLLTCWTMGSMAPSGEAHLMQPLEGSDLQAEVIGLSHIPSDALQPSMGLCS